MKRTAVQATVEADAADAAENGIVPAGPLFAELPCENQYDHVQSTCSISTRYLSVCHNHNKQDILCLYPVPNFVLRFASMSYVRKKPFFFDIFSSYQWPLDPGGGILGLSGLSSLIMSPRERQK